MQSLFSKPIKLDHALVGKLNLISEGFHSKHRSIDGLPEHYDLSTKAFDLAKKLSKALEHGREKFLSYEKATAKELLRKGREFINN